jgi:hypothetical protein
MKYKLKVELKTEHLSDFVIASERQSIALAEKVFDLVVNADIGANMATGVRAIDLVLGGLSVFEGFAEVAKTSNALMLEGIKCGRLKISVDEVSS